MHQVEQHRTRRQMRRSGAQLLIEQHIALAMTTDGQQQMRAAEPRVPLGHRAQVRQVVRADPGGLVDQAGQVVAFHLKRQDTRHKDTGAAAIRHPRRA